MPRNISIKIAASEEELEALHKLQKKYKQASLSDTVRRALWLLCLPSLEEVNHKPFAEHLFISRDKYRKQHRE